MLNPEVNRDRELTPPIGSKTEPNPLLQNSPSGGSSHTSYLAAESPLLELVHPGRINEEAPTLDERLVPDEKGVARSLFSPRAYFDALRECAVAFRSSALGVWEALPGGGLTRAVIVGGVGSVATILGVMAPVQAVGIAAGIVVIHGLTYRDNHLIRAQSSIGQTLFAAHLALLGAWPAATQSTLSAIRPVFLSMVAEDSKALRVVGGLVGFGVVGTFFSYTMLAEPLFQFRNLPLCVMALSTLAEALPRRLSWGSRVSLLVCATSLVPYHALISGSWMGIGINLISIGALVKSMVKHDVRKRVGSD